MKAYANDNKAIYINDFIKQKRKKEGAINLRFISYNLHIM